MATTTLKTRIQNKYDSYTNWTTNDPVLLSGEIAIVTMPTAADDINQVPAVLFKVGDGTSKFSELKFVTAVAGDVYDWAKAATKPAYAASEITGLEDFIAGEIQDTDTTYQLVSVNKATFKLQSKEKGSDTWTDVGAPIDIIYTLEEGTTNGTVSFNGTNVKVHGLGTAAYTDSDAYDAAGAADAVKGTSGDAATAITVYGARKYTDEQVAAAVSSAYKAAGSVTFANLPAPSAAEVGKVYNISDAFTADNTFVSGEVGNKYPAGTNVVTIEESDGVYKHDVLAGFVDLSAYAKSDDVTTEIGNAKTELIGTGTATATTIKGAVAEANSHTDTEVDALEARVDALETTADGLAPIAKTGNVNDLVQTAGDYIIFNCGTASTVI